MNGVKVTVGGAEYVVPRLSVGTYKRISKLAASASDSDGVDLLINQILLVLQGNYPDLSAAVLEEGILFEDLLATHAAVLAASGVKPPKGEEVSP